MGRPHDSTKACDYFVVKGAFEHPQQHHRFLSSSSSSRSPRVSDSPTLVLGLAGHSTNQSNARHLLETKDLIHYSICATCWRHSSPAALRECGENEQVHVGTNRADRGFHVRVITKHNSAAIRFLTHR
jgi:hypothetical protein